MPNKYCSQDPATKNKFGRQKEKNGILQHAVDEIILQEKKISVKYETHDKIDDEVYENEL